MAVSFLGSGSSPLTRGKRKKLPLDDLDTRLIPAHAGKTVEPGGDDGRAAAHPRSRGENSWLGNIDTLAGGSSPLTRGKRRWRCHGAHGPRLIPAHAGKTLLLTSTSVLRTAHPRSRGENLAWAVEGAREYGSSPLTRGKRGERGSACSMIWLIPAHAGKTRSRRGSARISTAHPRSRGENRSLLTDLISPSGSSPLTRGKQGVDRRGGPARGLIPAHAGKTAHVRRCDHLTAAHPRSRGENGVWERASESAGGSSPLTRGKLDYSRPRGKGNGLIPAHAGKTVSRTPLQSSGPAHPRSRGENLIPRTTRVIAAGSSPLTRGKRMLPSWKGPEDRLIPAHAGKTR